MSRPVLLLIAIIAAAAAARAGGPVAPDVSWLLTVSEKVLSGERLYLDVVETNPPASVSLYLPAAALGAATGLAPEALVLVGVSGLAVATLLFAGFVLRRHGPPENWTATAIAAGFAASVLPGMEFGQREHVALLLVAPALAVLACRLAEVRAVPVPPALVAGVAAGLAFTIKPHFGLGYALPLVLLAWRRRSARAVFTPEAFAAAAVLLAYAGYVLAAYPAFFDLLPLLADVYRPARIEWYVLVLPLAAVLVPWAAWAATARLPTADPLTSVALAATAGFFLGYLEQGKGWSYHYLPAAMLLAFLVLRTWIGTAPSLARSDRLRAALATVTAILAVGWPTYLYWPTPVLGAGLAAAIRDPVRPPALMVLAGDFAVGHPLVRDVSGVWVGTTNAQWVSTLAAIQRADHPERRPELDRWIAWDIGLAADDMREGRPDFVVADSRSTAGSLGRRLAEPSREVTAAFARLEAELERYEAVASEGPLTLLRRRPAAPSQGPETRPDTPRADHD